MKIHYEGFIPIVFSMVVTAFLTIGMIWLFPVFSIFHYTFFFVELIVLFLIISFFRIPYRKYVLNNQHVLSPADGKVVVVEEINDKEYFHDRRIQVSVFMSPLNVHVNRYPFSGVVRYVKYFPGKYLVAWHPKSSTDNERFSTVIEHSSGKQVLIKQIAGAVARRICNYAAVSEQVEQCNELGFIKFGSRVDLILPCDLEITVRVGQKVKSGMTVLAKIKE